MIFNRVGLVGFTRVGIESGMLAVNSFVVSTPETPFGGINESGYGSEGGIEGLDAYLQTKFVTEVGV